MSILKNRYDKLVYNRCGKSGLKLCSGIKLKVPFDSAASFANSVLRDLVKLELCLKSPSLPPVGSVLQESVSHQCDPGYQSLVSEICLQPLQ
jgi:hypothetical protein